VARATGIRVWGRQKRGGALFPIFSSVRGERGLFLSNLLRPRREGGRGEKKGKKEKERGSFFSAADPSLARIFGAGRKKKKKGLFLAVIHIS